MSRMENPTQLILECENLKIEVNELRQLLEQKQADNEHLEQRCDNLEREKEGLAYSLEASLQHQVSFYFFLFFFIIW